MEREEGLNREEGIMNEEKGNEKYEKEEHRR